MHRRAGRYLRLPYDPAAGGDHTISITQEHASEEGDETATTSIFRANDREVRLTIISVIARHLQQARGASSWVGHDFDFAGATFDGGDFTRCRFTGNARFDDAEFAGGVVTFDGARFTGSRVTHNGVPFRGWPAE